MNSFRVPIKNALFMYSYIWDKADSADIISLDATDTFCSSNIFAELFIINARKVFRSGLYKQYINRNDVLSTIKGRIDFKNTNDKQTLLNGKIFCDFDEFEENNIYNQILKTVAINLYKSTGLSNSHKNRLSIIIFSLSNVSYIDIKSDTFKHLSYNKMNKNYYLIMKVCELIVSKQMLSAESGKYEFLDLFNDDKHMNTIFELFVNKFYKQELPRNQYKVGYQNTLKWNFDGGNQDLLPDMKADTIIQSKHETIVLDTKYYQNYYVENAFEKKELRSGHLYQITSYLNNVNYHEKLRGILLYPQPFDEDPINESYNTKIYSNCCDTITTATIQFVTVDLSNSWDVIKRQLLSLITDTN